MELIPVPATFVSHDAVKSHCRVAEVWASLRSVFSATTAQPFLIGALIVRF